MDISGNTAARPLDATSAGFFKRLSLCLTGNPNAVIALFGVYFLVQAIVRQLVPPALRIDEAQQVLFAQWLALGYDAQPPLYNWYQHAIFRVFGTSMATLAFAKNFILFLTFAVYTKTAELVLRDKRLVVVAALSLYVIPQVFWQAQRDLTHTAMLMLTFASMLYVSIKLIQRPTTIGYLLVGLAAGLGMLSKYNFALILPALLFAVWMHPQGRTRILDRRFLLTILTAFIVFLPHVFWLINNLGFASDVTLKRMAEDAPDNRLLQIGRGLGRFIAGSTIIITAPTLLLWLTARREKSHSPASESSWFRFFFHYFMAIAVLMILVILMTTMTELRDRWLLPLLMPFPILATLLLEGRGFDTDQFVGRFLAIPFVMMVLVPIALLASQPFISLTGRASSSNYDWQAFHNHIVENEKISPSVIITPNWPSGGNLRFVFKDVPVATVTYDDYDPIFNVSNERPILMAWTGDSGGDQVASMTAWLKDQIKADVQNVQVSTFDVPMYYPIENKKLRFNYAIVRPANIKK
jgi:hypothetical protein